MSSKELFRAGYPIYSVGRLAGNDTEFYVTGGGGKAKTGVPNALDVYKLSCEGGQCVSIPVHYHDMGTSIIMNSATHPKRGSHLAVGVDGECCAVEIRREDTTSKKSKVKVKRRKRSHSSSDEDTSVNSGQSHILIERARVQTDFSEECYQKVVSFTCDGGRVVTGGSDGVIRVWEYPSLKKVCELKGHKNEIETLSCHPSQQQVVTMCRGGSAIVWDLTNHDREHTFTWSPGQHGKDAIAEQPIYRFRACCFSPEGTAGQDHTSLFTLSIPISVKRKQQKCYLLKWDAGVWLVEEQTITGNELLSAVAIDVSGRYIGVGTISGGVLIYSSDLKLLSKVSGVHSVFVTGLVFLPLSTAGNSKREKLALISVSADRTCSATFVRRKSRTFNFIFLFLLVLLLVVAIATKHQGLW